MEEKKFLKIIDNLGKEIEYEILIIYYWATTNKNYIVYTDNTKDENGNLNIFAAIFYPQDDSKIDAIETEEEWEEVEKRLRDLHH